MKRISVVLMTTFVVLTATACNSSTVSNESTTITRSMESASMGTGIINISNNQLQALLDKQVTLVDIRRIEEWAETGIVPGSKKLTFFSKTGGINPKLVPELKKIAPSDKPVALICRVGNRTKIAAQILNTQLGYETVYNVTEGITQWIKNGRKTIR